MFVETNWRSVYKAITWRITTSILTFIASYIVTGSFGGAGAIAGILFVVNSFWYYFHERLWNTRCVGKLSIN